MDLATALEAVEAVFDAMGVEAKYGTGDPGDGDDCDVVLWRPGKTRESAGLHVSGYGIAERPLYILVRREQVAAPLIHMAFRMEEGGAVYRIGEDTPVPHDIHGLVWRCFAVLEAS